MYKKFSSKKYPEYFYEVVDEGWMGKDTYLMVFQTMTDVDGDNFHIEVEYHKSDNEIVYTRCYDDEVTEIIPCFKEQIDEYILKQVGKLREDSMLNKQKFEIELTLDVPLDMSVGELEEWLKNDLEVSVMIPIDSKVNILKIKKK